ncbi:hypothetical protein PALB_22030 [Pseudoalteromonas luteoviolacea B = ATCC 29581]|nr:hypothetical protein PALB_22030 [Pseudoalteromonas luteoviolacea B = ATCC 29581]
MLQKLYLLKHINNTVLAIVTPVHHVRYFRLKNERLFTLPIVKRFLRESKVRSGFLM